MELRLRISAGEATAIIASQTQKAGFRMLLGGTFDKLFIGTVTRRRFRFYKDLELGRFPAVFTGRVMETEYGCMIRAQFNSYKILIFAFLTAASIGFLLSLGLLAEACFKRSVGPELFFALCFTFCMVLFGTLYFRTGLRFRRRYKEQLEEAFVSLFEGIERYQEERIPNSKPEIRNKF